jgi:hypothetical protein
MPIWRGMADQRRWPSYMKIANISLRVHPDGKAAGVALVAEEHLEESAYVRRLLIEG